MVLTEIIQFDAGSTTERSPSTSLQDKVTSVITSLNEVQGPVRFVFGAEIQDQGLLQITSERSDSQDGVDLKTPPELGSSLSSARSSFGEPKHIYHVNFNRPILGKDGAATSNVVEFAQVYFPASRVTPEFQKQIVADFSKFDEIFLKGARGNDALAYGWILEEQGHKDLEGEHAKCFLVARGWESMKSFEQSVATDAFKEAVPILGAWNTPSQMWHIERKFQYGN